MITSEVSFTEDKNIQICFLSSCKLENCIWNMENILKNHLNSASNLPLLSRALVKNVHW